ncbi:MAG: hypothetical protein JKX84_01465 [Flavobacteriales bacterium]|nr:hypothetical protein [Flavobacteriales bacterium]
MNLAATRVFSENEVKKIGRDILRSETAVRLRLSGNSMFPFLLRNDVAIIEPIPVSELKVGQVVVFENDDRWIAHRLVLLNYVDEKVQLQTQGDSLPRADKIFGEKDYLGVISAVFRNDKELNLNGFLSESIAWAMVNFRPVSQMVSRITLRIRNKLGSAFGSS